jgi:hypothetical protein
MTMTIQHIDALAREKRRDVAYIEFRRPAARQRRVDAWDDDKLVTQWKDLASRRKIVQWLDAQAIGYQPCAEFADEGRMLSYRGQLYIDLPVDASSPAFQALTLFLEKPDGRARLAGVKFLRCTLAQAMTNAAHDEPGFWERWAETF